MCVRAPPVGLSGEHCHNSWFSLHLQDVGERLKDVEVEEGVTREGAVEPSLDHTQTHTQSQSVSGRGLVPCDHVMWCQQQQQQQQYLKEGGPVSLQHSRRSPVVVLTHSGHPGEHHLQARGGTASQYLLHAADGAGGGV